MDIAEQSKQQVAPWAEGMARFGYAAKGVVYVIIGILAFQAAFTVGTQPADSSGALREILSQPFGRVLLFIVAVGLIGYVLWRLAQGFLDAENKGSDVKGIFKRLGYVLSGLAYGGLALTAFQLALGMTGGGGGDSSEIWTSRLLSVPFGRWLVALVGLAAIGLAVNAVYIALSGLFKKKLNLEEMGEATRRWASLSARVGLVARGVVLGIIGWFFIQAAWQANASQAGDASDALARLEQMGPWVLGVIAVGVMAYGLYAIVQARYRRINLS